MTNADRECFGELLAQLGDVFGEELSAARVHGYWLALEDLPLGDVERSVAEALRECKFFPRPAELRALAGAQPVTPGWVNRQLSNGLSGKPVDPFVALFVERLGGWRGVEDRLPVERLPLVERLYPGIVAACRAREIPIPTEASVMLRPPRRSLTAGERLRLAGRDE
jgi:hypothetical protein